MNTFGLLTGASILALSVVGPAHAQQAEQGRVTDEIVVTAEKREASVQDVPIAISAFDEGRLERLQLNDAQDLVLAIPNFGASKNNFNGNNITIRGVGTKLVATSGDSAVGVHINGAPSSSVGLFEGEFFDVSRVEVLRGPQGTLYGRNASSGVMNVITAKPELEELSGGIEGTYGNYNTYKANGHINLPVGDSFAVRLAGFFTQRDGFTEDLNSGKDVDGRDMFGLRGTAFAQLSDNADATLMVQYFQEDSNRSRIGKQLCVTDTRPFPFSQGCLPRNVNNQFGILNSSASLGGVGGILFGVVSPTVNGGNLGVGGLNPADYRKVALTFQPVHQSDELVATLEFNYDFGPVKFTSLSHFNKTETRSSVDYNQVRLGTNWIAGPFTPGGVFTGPRTGAQRTLATFDESLAEAETLTQEFRLTSDLDGWFNYTIGYIAIDSEAVTDYQVISSSLELIGTFQNAVLGANIPPALFNFSSLTDPFHLEASAFFGEAYFTPIEDLKITLGLRQTSDEKSVRDAQVLYAPAQFRTEKASFEETTGRFTVDYSSSLPFTEETNWFASYAKGYKGGGINPPFDPNLFAGIAKTFEPEFIDAYEIGMKNVLADGRATANFSAFYYEYNGYQITRIVNRTSVNANIDATIKGLEAEMTWEPVNGLVFDMNLGYLDSEITDSLGGLIDPINITNGNTNYTNVTDAFTPTGGLGSVRQCIVSNAALATLTPAQYGAACTILSNFGGDALNGSDGIKRKLEGNELPNAPELTVSFGAQYTMQMPGSWAATVRGDYYYQAESFSRIFNAPNDQLESYTQLNASLRFENQDAGLYANLFVKNLTDEEVITDLYLTDQSSGLFTNAFLLEPRTYGITIGKKF